MDCSKDQQKKTEGEKEFTTQPIKHDGIDPKLAALQAQPGPVIPDKLPAEEGTKEERQARMETLNNK
ncbi:hypothetical protein CDD83_3029 [Cordyceps sp. RAO-2017]|nr:hypothetical protein CDD83_3029 [Cordyceps sp. RAO-2017]